MKVSLKFIALVSFCLFGYAMSAQIYVNATATGANDGTSWTDAYADLSKAMEASNPNDVLWIAEGTYLPGGTSPSRDTSFILPHNLKIYGGFAGTETALEQRDWEANATILSGDYAGDDVDNNFTDNKTDNARHVMFIGSSISGATVIDGIQISYGTTDDSTSSDDLRRGAGILCYGLPKITNCTFTQNYGYFGGGLYPRGSQAGTIEITDCVFENNRAGFGAGVYINQLNGTIQGCLFNKNTSESSGGGLYVNVQNGAMVTNCSFTENVSIDSRGGGLYITTSPTTVMDCEFLGNAAGTRTGGNIHVTHGDDEPSVITNIINCKLENGVANWGGAVTAYSLGTDLRLLNCEIMNNEAYANGGAVMVGFGAAITLTDCDISYNSTARNGGAINSQNDTSSVTVINSNLSFNTSENNGGAINMSSDTTIDAQKPLLTLNNSTFIFNACAVQGGAINLLNCDLDMESSVFVNNNNASTTGAGGAMSINAFNGITTEARIMNSTFYENNAALGGVIGHFTDSTGVSRLAFQNNILTLSSGGNYAVEGGTPEVISGGGNHIDDNSMTTILNGLRDEHNTDPKLDAPAFGEFGLASDSPCVDTGVSTGAPDTDILGVARVGEVDKGAYEFNVMSTSEDLETSIKQLKVFPNPVKETLNYKLTNDWTGPVVLTLRDYQGAVIYQDKLNKIGEQIEATIDVSDLAPAVYLLNLNNLNNLNNSGASVSRGFVKL